MTKFDQAEFIVINLNENRLQRHKERKFQVSDNFLLQTSFYSVCKTRKYIEC